VHGLTLAALAGLLGACAAAAPGEALRLGPESLQQRQLQTRRFDGTTEAEILAAAAGVLQDLGFVIDESETGLGLMVASKRRSATNVAQQVTAVLVELVLGWPMATDEEQTIRASLVSRPATGAVAAAAADSFHVRVTFQRLVRNDRRQVSEAEPLDDPALYEGFFERLSKSVFLEAHKI
jgi:hypothetical protein